MSCQNTSGGKTQYPDAEMCQDPEGDRSANTVCQEPSPRLLLEGIAQLNQGEYFEQHETLETLWRHEQREVRRMYQGILQIGVAFYHLGRLNHHGTVYMLTRGSRYLEPFAPRCQNVDVERLIRDAKVALVEVERLGPDRLCDFDWALAPTVHLCR